jgi:thioredoxin-like negative regulator of GroEL
MKEKGEGAPNVGRLNVDENVRTAKKFKVYQIPQVLIFYEGYYYNYTRDLT